MSNSTETPSCTLKLFPKLLAPPPSFLSLSPSLPPPSATSSLLHKVIGMCSGSREDQSATTPPPEYQHRVSPFQVDSDVTVKLGVTQARSCSASPVGAASEGRHYTLTRIPPGLVPVAQQPLSLPLEHDHDLWQLVQGGRGGAAPHGAPDRTGSHEGLT